MRPAWCVTTNATSPSCRRACGSYVERVARLAPGDVIGAGAPIAELLVPQWAPTHQEYLALKATGDVELTAAAEARMRLAGMPERLIREVKASGRIQDRIAITAPIGGELQSLDVRRGITLSAGQTLARINGIASVWLDVAVPQAQAALVRTGQTAEARFAAFPGETVAGRVIAILPGVDPGGARAHPAHRTAQPRRAHPPRPQRRGANRRRGRDRAHRADRGDEPHRRPHVRRHGERAAAVAVRRPGGLLADAPPRRAGGQP